MKATEDIEIPLGKRTLKYRFFEMVPALISYGALILLIVLSISSPILAAIFLLLVVLTTFVKALGIASRTIQGYKRLKNAQTVDWQKRLEDVAFVQKNDQLPENISTGWRQNLHKLNLQTLQANQQICPKLGDIYNAVIVAAYNEGPETLEPTLKSVLETSFPADKTILCLAYEARGGQAMEQTAQDLKQIYGHKFFSFHLVKHPENLPKEIIGKGANISFAGKYLQKWLKKNKIATENVIVTTLDSDNRPAKDYFSAVTYEYILRSNRHRLSFQPISLFLNNIWDVPAPMRVIATGNSFWNIISSTRPHTLRNFASHSQGMQALSEMNFWSTRTIVEDGHQFWRSYFYFKGKYNVVPIYIPIYQDAVLSHSYRKTLKAQFVQLRRWAYGASDVAYVADRVFTKNRQVPLVAGFAHFVRLLDSHVTLAVTPLLVAFGGWIPLLLNQDAARSIVAHELPEIVSLVQRIALIGIFVTVFLTFKMLPPRPKRYKRHRTVLMLLQWLLMPFTAIVYSSMAAFNSQTHLLLGKYLDKFDVTSKAVKNHK